ncbi:hypothetical protein NESM_000212800 [Novymonas esmeraldas]|uniref:Uncharacterized protein n=1 Tax=Novymonas esmeraldas TaxID=1808958 RepID=A0AAW0F5E9_9TRYP
MLYYNPVRCTVQVPGLPCEGPLSAEELARLPLATRCASKRPALARRSVRTGNVVIGDLDELRQWSVTASPVAARHAKKHGGYLEWSTGDASEPVLYFKFDRSSDRVYGRGVPYTSRKE